MLKTANSVSRKLAYRMSKSQMEPECSVDIRILVLKDSLDRERMHVSLLEKEVCYSRIILWWGGVQKPLLFNTKPCRQFYKVTHIQLSLTYPDYSLIRTPVREPLMNTYIESISLIWIFSYPDSHLGNGGVRISEAPL